jgi:hypothetical protein
LVEDKINYTHDNLIADKLKNYLLSPGRLFCNVILRHQPKNLTQSVILNEVKDLMSSFAMLRTSFKEFILSQNSRPFVSLRATGAKGLE